MFDIGFLEMMVIGVLALIVLGPERLPGAIKSCIKTVRSIKEIANGFKEEVSAQIDAHDLHTNLKKAEELGMQNIGKDLQASVNELKAAAASVQRPYQKAKPDSLADLNSIGSAQPESQEVPAPDAKASSVASHADFDDYQHNPTHYAEDDGEAKKALDNTDSSFDHALLDESIKDQQLPTEAVHQGELFAESLLDKSKAPKKQKVELAIKQANKPHE